MARTRPNFVPNDVAGSKHETAVLLVGTASEFGISQQEIAMVSGGFWISDALYDVLYDEDVIEEPEPEPASTPEPEPTPEVKTKSSTKKTSGNRAAKTSSTEQE